MAIGITYPTGNQGVLQPTSPAFPSFEWVRLTKDGTLTTATVVLPSNSPMKTILTWWPGGLIAASPGIAAGGVAATTGFTVNFAAGSNGDILDIFVFGKA